MNYKTLTQVGGALAALAVASLIFVRKVQPVSYSFGVYLGIALAVGVAPYGVLVYLEDRENSILDKDLLDYLSQVESYVKSGKNLLFAITLPINERKRPLKRRLQKLDLMLKLGVNPDDALQRTALSMPTIISKEAFSVIHRLIVYGGNVGGVLESVREHLGDLYSIESEKRSIMRNYGSIIYISYFILLIIGIFILKFFVYRMVTTSFASPFSSSLNSTLLKALILQFLVVEGLFSGLIAGKLMTGRMSSGLLHSAIMIVLGLAAYSLFV